MGVPTSNPELYVEPSVLPSPSTFPFRLPSPSARCACVMVRYTLVKDTREGNADGVRKALEAGEDPDQLSCQWGPQDEMRAIHYAAYHGHADIARLLLDAGADHGRRANGSYTPLHYAVFFKFEGVVRKLLDAGADPLEPDHDGVTPLDKCKDETIRAMLLASSGHAATAMD